SGVFGTRIFARAMRTCAMTSSSPIPEVDDTIACAAKADRRVPIVNRQPVDRAARVLFSRVLPADVPADPQVPLSLLRRCRGRASERLESLVGAKSRRRTAHITLAHHLPSLSVRRLASRAHLEPVQRLSRLFFPAISPPPPHPQ